MALTPVEIKHIRLERSFFGYKRSFVDQVLEDVASSFEDVWRDRADLADKVEHLEHELVRFRELEALLRTTLVSAERASQELKEQARKESELVLTEAHAEARAIAARARRARAPDDRGAADPLAPSLRARLSRGRGRVPPSRRPPPSGRGVDRLRLRVVPGAAHRHRGPLRPGLEGASRRAAERGARTASSSSSPDARRPPRGPARFRPRLA